MNTKKIFIPLLLLLIVQSFSFVLGLTPGDYNQKFWGGGLHVWLSYPEDASPGDTININIYILSSKFPRGNQIESVQAKVTVLSATSSVTLYSGTIISNTRLDSGDAYNQTLSLKIPNDARWYVTVQMDTVSYQVDMTNRQEAHVTLDCTKIRLHSYQDLEQHKQELQAYLNQVNNKINELQTQLNNLLGGETPQKEYLELMESYVNLSEQYSVFLQENQTISDPELVNQVAEMSDVISVLEEELRDYARSLDEEMILRDEHIIALTNENRMLIEEIDRQIAEKEEAIESLNEYQESYTISQEDYDELNSRVDGLSSTRLYLLIALVIAVVACVAVYIKLGTR